MSIGFLVQVTNKNYYQKVDDFEEEMAKRKIKHVGNTITKYELKAMEPEEEKTAKFYCNFKIHKAHNPMEAPP